MSWKFNKKNQKVGLPEEFIGLQDRIDNFKKVVKSKDLLYNFDTNQIIRNKELRKRVDNKDFRETIFREGGKPIPVFGFAEEIERVKTYWLPLIRRYDEYLQNLKRTNQSKYNLFSLPIDLFILMIKVGKVKAKDIINSCSVDHFSRDYCNKYENRIYMAFIELEYPDRAKEVIPGYEKKSYFKLKRGLSDFWEKHKNKLGWGWLSYNKNVSESFYEKNLDKVDWMTLSGNPNMSEEFYERHLDKVNWFGLSGNTNISEQFFERHLDKVSWFALSRNTNISEQFFERHLDKVSWDLLSGNPNISEQFFERHLDKVVWGGLSINNNISEEFFEKHLDKVDWMTLSRNTNMSEEFFERHLDRVDWGWLSKNPNMSEEFFERHLDKVSWFGLSGNTNMSEEFFERHLDKVNWDELSRNTNMSEEFYERHIDKVNWQLLLKTMFKPSITIKYL